MAVRDLGPDWQPLLSSAELQPGGPPLRASVAGEQAGLVAFRDANGRVGVFHEACPHVGTARASLALGQTESDGLRCRFHGWKFDVTGACIDIPDLPKSVDFGRYPRARALETVERGGLIWVRL
jgi:phthalate 4,5-dioxygenase oxygenase subunit